MGQAQSSEFSCGDIGFLPSYHLLKLQPADLERLFVPRDLVSRCDLCDGAKVAIADCLGRVFTATMHSCCVVYFLGNGWPEFIVESGAKRNDYIFFKFKNARACKVTVLAADGVQKYPKIDGIHIDHVIPRDTAVLGWPQPASPQRAIRAGPCTRSVLMDESDHPSTTQANQGYPDIPTATGTWQGHNGAIYNAHGIVIDPELKGWINRWDQAIYLAFGADDRVPAKLAIGFDERAYINDGWDVMVDRYELQEGTKCIFKFDKFGGTITVVLYLL
ncbi:hypothetical protein PR202_ga31277 [Eleusine coracana subsp. coracana]|uniref:TF-B3 domain-containing protein n=1 Tax=Eleusine coracana subsp. coracana TaxID=191504 RepID=A0AAV5DQZ5_ELECO|nr:hypothetical protein PR202_ga31277 [Eleusine coracana subsp. coracana]